LWAASAVQQAQARRAPATSNQPQPPPPPPPQPKEDKYRRIKLRNEKINTTIVQVENALDALRAMGWVQEEAELEYLVIPAGKYMSMKEVSWARPPPLRAAATGPALPPTPAAASARPCPPSLKSPCPLGAARSTNPRPLLLQVRSVEDAKDRLKKAIKEEARNK
jgi:hypothetical protein